MVAARYGFYMAGYKAPDFTDRAAASKAAKLAALEKLRTKPAADPAVIAAREAKEAARKAAAAERRAERLAAAEAEKAAKVAAAEAAREEEAAAAPKPAKTAEELKAARDARYAARKARKR